MHAYVDLTLSQQLNYLFPKALHSWNPPSYNSSYNLSYSPSYNLSYTVQVELTVPQKQYYRAIYEMNTSFLYRGEAKDGPRLSNLAMELRKCCNHPFLIKGDWHCIKLILILALCLVTPI